MVAHATSGLDVCGKSRRIPRSRTRAFEDFFTRDDEHAIAGRGRHWPEAGEIPEGGEYGRSRPEPETGKTRVEASGADQVRAGMQVSRQYVCVRGLRRHVCEDERWLDQWFIDRTDADGVNVTRFPVVVATNNGHGDAGMRCAPRGDDA